MTDKPFKVLILGPQGAGKSVITNYLSRYKDTPDTIYQPTNPLRIFQMEVNNSAHKNIGKSQKIEVELWDVSGDPKHQSCWKGIGNNADAILYVVNPFINNQEKELELWHKSFAVPNNISQAHTRVLFHYSKIPNDIKSMSSSSQTIINTFPPLPSLSKSLLNTVTCRTCIDIPSISDSLVVILEELVQTVFKHKQQLEENSLLN